MRQEFPIHLSFLPVLFSNGDRKVVPKEKAAVLQGKETDIRFGGLLGQLELVRKDTRKKEAVQKKKEAVQRSSRNFCVGSFG